MICPHENFVADCDVARLTDTEGGPVTAYKLDVKINCADCGEPFVFVGPIPTGMLADRPTIDLAGLTLCCPVRPQSAPPEFGMGALGYTVQVHGPSAAN